eukprot:c9144_g1_i1.p1 GENE.c9144_g1_i1~~c9144_g1_i1.p1  ORF type:complete len:616 (+),score=134.83 c9144_g1_i1:63-1910(+)
MLFSWCLLFLIFLEPCIAWRNVFQTECVVNEIGATKCQKADGGSCQLRRLADDLSVDSVRAKCPDYTTSSTPLYHNPLLCSTMQPDRELAQALANNMFQKCGQWCVFSDTTPQDRAWFWERGCWQKSTYCLELGEEKDYAISQKLKFCPDLQTAKDLLATGKVSGALNMFDALITANVAENDRELAELLSYRAFSNAMLAREDAARHDGDKAVSMDEDSPLPRFYRAKARLTVGKADDALSDIEGARSRLNNVAGAVTEQELKKLQSQIESAQNDLDLGIKALNSDVYVSARYHFDQARKVMGQSASIRLYLAECDLASGSEAKAEEILSEIAALIRADPSNIHALMVRGRAYELVGNLDMALNHLKEALRLDPDHVRCKKAFKRLRKLQGLVSEADDLVNKRQSQQAVDLWNQILATKPPRSFEKNTLFKLCREYNKMKKFKEAADLCSKVLEIDNNHLDALLERGDARVALEDYDKAIRDFETAFNTRDGRTRDVEQKLQNAKRLLKQSKMKDYYKILGVSRTASDREIKASYRKLALQWHPDKHQGEEKEVAEVRFQEVALAYEILSDPEKRAMVDRGEDPTDQSGGGGGGGGSPFGQGFGFGGRTFHFRFG